MAKAVVVARSSGQLVEQLGVSSVARTGVGAWAIDAPSLKPNDHVLVTFAGAPYQSAVKTDGTKITLELTNRAGNPVDPFFVLVVEEGG